MSSIPEFSTNPPKPWLRLLYIVLFWIIFNIAEVLIVVMVIVQFISQLAAGNVNTRLQTLGSSTANYVHQVIRFLTYATDELPFPFGPWPGATKDIDLTSHDAR